MNSRDQSDAIWISRQQEPKLSGVGSKSFSSGGYLRGQSSFDFGTSNKVENPRFGFARSMSVNSEGASTTSSSSTNASPPISPIDINNRKGGHFGTPGGVGGGRFRTSSFSAGYGPSYGNDSSLSGFDTSDPYLIHSPLSTSAPGQADARGAFKRSNSISVGALEHSHGRKTSSGLSGGQPPLGPIEEYHKMATFGDAFKRSMDHIFSAPKIQAVGPRFGSGSANSPAIKEKKQMKDHVVSMLCESAIR